MGGVATQFGGDLNVVYWSDDDDERLETSLTAVVAWRLGAATTHGWRARLRRWQYQLGIDPLHRRVSIGRDAGLWGGSAGSNGEHETLFHMRRRLIRVLGREYQLPTREKTLVLLVDERRVPADIRVKVMQAPTVPLTPPMHDPMRGSMSEIDAWREFLRSDTEIAAFVVDSAT